MGELFQVIFRYFSNLMYKYECRSDHDRSFGWLGKIEEARPLAQKDVRAILDVLLLERDQQWFRYNARVLNKKVENLTESLQSSCFRQEAQYLVLLQSETLRAFWTREEGPEFNFQRTLWYYAKINL